MDHSSISLSRLAITGVVTTNTPFVVLKEIADAHSINVDEYKIKDFEYLSKLINMINTKHVKVISQPYDINDYKLIARFVNCDYEWDKKKLMYCFDILIQYMNLEKLKQPHHNFKYGQQTPIYPDNLNACVLYGICKANNINTHLYTTMDEMATNIQILFSPNNILMQRFMRMSIADSMIFGECDTQQLINILNEINSNKLYRIKDMIVSNSIIPDIDEPITYEDLRHAGNVVLNQLVRTQPKTHTEAIAMAAIHYKLDISKVKNPLNEYQEIEQIPYFPLDSDLALRLRVSKIRPTSLDNPYINKVFNPEFPANLYNDDDLAMMCAEEGYKYADIRLDGAYTILQTCCFISTFFHGKEGNILNTENTLFDELNELKYDNVLVYGTKDTGMYFYTYTELSETFRIYRRFQNPENNELFPEITINKLHILCKKPQRSTENISDFEERLELAEIIDSVRMFQQINQDQIRRFAHNYETYDNDIRNLIKVTLTHLLHCSMYMRGWDGESSYPLTAEQSNMGNDSITEINVTESLIKLEEILDELNDFNQLGDEIKNLPLIFYHYHSNELLPSTNEEEGITIQDRIEIVKGGETGTIQSCIRMSSNRFASTAYYYMRIIGMSEPFNIEALAQIM